MVNTGIGQKRRKASRQRGSETMLTRLMAMVGSSVNRMALRRSIYSASRGVATSGKPNPAAPWM